MTKLTERVIEWTSVYFKNTNGTKAVIGISGGKDSSVAAAICAAALGKENVIGVEMPNGIQSDIDCSEKLINHLGIAKRIVNINAAFNSILTQVSPEPSYNAKVNLPARLRMASLYAIAQQEGARVANTCNRSEDVVGYSTLWGDSVNDFSPFGLLTTEEVMEIGDDLGLPYELVHKTPSDGLCGKSDEDNLGFTYAEINKIIRTGEKTEHFDEIVYRYMRNRFKLEMINLPRFKPNRPDYFLENYKY